MMPSGQSTVSSPLSRLSAYSVMRSIHCFIMRRSTGSPVSMYLPSWTSSLASTVPRAGAPVDSHLGLIGQALFVELHEDPLGPAIERDIRRRDLTRPVVRQAEFLQLLFEASDIAPRDLARVLALLDGLALGRQAERIPAHDPQYIETHHALGSGHDVGRHIPLGMADVEPGAAGIGKHVEDVIFGFLAVCGRGESLFVVPVFLPLGVDNLVFVSGHGFTVCSLFCSDGFGMATRTAMTEAMTSRCRLRKSRVSRMSRMYCRRPRREIVWRSSGGLGERLGDTGGHVGW